MNLKYIEGCGVDCINLVQGGDMWRILYEVGDEYSGFVKCWECRKLAEELSAS